MVSNQAGKNRLREEDAKELMKKGKRKEVMQIESNLNDCMLCGCSARKDERQRIESDIHQFHENVGEVKVTDETKDVIELAKQYCEDTQYFLDRKDYVTAFGCINYAHGLIDAYRKKWRE